MPGSLMSGGPRKKKDADILDPMKDMECHEVALHGIEDKGG